MKSCDLCKSFARIYCESDQASLCWSCDAKVHSANFLVARHSRSLLCGLCQSPTPWTASGQKLVPSAVSVCESCVVDDDDDEIGTDHDDDEYDGDEDGEEEIELEDEDDYKAAPWSSPPPPSAASSTSSNEFSICDRGGSAKRKRQNVTDLSSEDDLDCSSVQRKHRTPSHAVAKAAVEGALLHSLPATSEVIVGNFKRNRHGNMISDETYCTPVVGMDKATRCVGLELD